MDILKRLQEHSRNIPEQPAIVSETEQLNYRQLEEYSNALASCVHDRMLSGVRESGEGILPH